MMNTRNLTGKTLKIVKEGVNGAIFHPHSKRQGSVFKAGGQVEATSKFPQYSSYEMTASKHVNQTNENETAHGTVFLSKNHIPNQKSSLDTHFNVGRNHVSYTFSNPSSSADFVPLPSEFICGIATGSLGPKGDQNLMMQQRRMMSTRAVNAKRGTIEGIITTLNDKFNADIVNDTQAIYQFNILSGDNREIYYIDLRNGSGSAGKGKSEACPDTIFSIDAENFNRLIEGNLRAPTAYMTGRMKISGSMQKAAKLEKLFATLMDKGTISR